MRASAPDILVLCGSPHAGGASERVASTLAACLERRGAFPTLWRLAEHPVAACHNCGGCATSGECVIADAWHVLSRHMDVCDALVLVAPVYFAGPPAHLKAALDRCQTYWMRKYRLHAPLPAERPAHLVVLGEGGDPFGTDALEAVCTSALNCANLRIEGRVKRFVGCEAADGDLAAIADALLAELACGMAESAVRGLGADVVDAGPACRGAGENAAGSAGGSGSAGDAAPEPSR